MKPGDIVTFYVDPKQTQPIDEVELLEKIRDLGVFEQWWFKYQNESGIKHKGLFKKAGDGTNK